MGLGDKIRGAISDATGASAITNALSGPAPAAKDPGDFVRSTRHTVGTTSGLDAAMQDHADKLHPVPSRKARPVMGADWDQ